MSSIRPESPRDWTTLIAIATLFASVVTSWVVLREAVTNLQSDTASIRRKDEQQDERLRGIETSRTIETQISDLKNKVVELQTTVNALRDDMRERRR